MSVAARKSITSLSHFSMENSLETCTCRHLPAFQSIFCWSVHRLQWRKRCSRVWAVLPHRRTTSICRRLGVRIVSSTCLLARARTSVGRTWLPVTSHYSLGWVSCTQLCPSVCSRSVCCICRLPTEPSLPTALQRFVWSYSPPRCIFVLILCLLYGLLGLGSLGDLHPHSWECRCVPQPSGSLFQYRLCEGSSRCGYKPG
jgi:hypothetical protein